MGSDIGSGWLFGARKGLPTAGPAVVISWVIGGVAVLVLALVHAGLGAMHPVSGGSARFPHYAFGGAAGASFGWFSWFGVITSFVVGCICFLPFPSWQSLVGLITSASVLMYAGAPLAFGALRRRLPHAARPYRLPGRARPSAGHP